MMLRRTLVPLFCLSLLLSSAALAAPPTRAWGATEKPIAAAQGPIMQYYSKMVKLSDGNVMLMWISNRDNLRFSLLSNPLLNPPEDQPTYDLFVQKFDSSFRPVWASPVKVSQGNINGGNIDTPDYICDINDSLYSFNLIADDRGGAIVSWLEYDDLNSNDCLYLQKLDSSGQKLWIKDDLPTISFIFDNCERARLASDGSGGAYVAWKGYVSNDGSYPGCLAHVDITGLSSSGPINIPDSLTNIGQIEIAPAPSGEVFAAWNISDNKNAISIARFDSTLNFKWGGGASALVSALISVVYNFTPFTLVSDGTNAYLAADSFANSKYGVNAQKIDGDGNLIWNDDGTEGIAVVSGISSIGLDNIPRVIADGLGGAYIGYSNADTDQDHNDLYLQGVGPGRTLKFANPVPLQVVTGYAGWLTLAMDTANNTVWAAWLDGRYINILHEQRQIQMDIFLKGVKEDGSVVAGGANGMGISLTRGYKAFPALTFIGSKLLSAWTSSFSTDSLWPTENNFDICGNITDASGNFLAGGGDKGIPVVDAGGPVPNLLPAVAGLAGGNSFVAWCDLRNGLPQIFYNIVDKNGNLKLGTDGLGVFTNNMDLGTAPLACRTSDGNVMLVWTGNIFDMKAFIEAMSILSPGKLAPRSKGAAQAKDVQKMNVLNPLKYSYFYALKINGTTGAKMWDQPVRMSNQYYLIDLSISPALAPNDDGGAVLAYGSLLPFISLSVHNSTKANQPARQAEPKIGFRRFATAPSANKPKGPAAPSMIYIKEILSSGGIAPGHSASDPGMPVADPAKFVTVGQAAPVMINDGAGNLYIAWMDTRREVVEVKSANVEASRHFLVFGQKVKLSDHSLLWGDTGVQLSPSVGADVTDDMTVVHCNPKISFINNTLGLTWGELIIDTKAQTTKTQIYAAAFDTNGAQKWVTPVSDQKTADYTVPDWDLLVLPDIKFLNTRLDSAVIWQDIHLTSARLGPANQQGGVFSNSIKNKGVGAKFGGDQQLLNSPMVISGAAVYAMQLDASGAKKLSAPFQVSTLDKTIIYPLLADPRDNCSQMIFWGECDPGQALGAGKLSD